MGGSFFNEGLEHACVISLGKVEVQDAVSTGQDTKSASSPLLYVQFNQSDSSIELSIKEGEEVVLGKSG